MPTDAGVLWFKESAPLLAFEPALTALVFARRPDDVPEPVAFEGARMLTRDCGESWRDAGAAGRATPAWDDVLRLYAELQLGLVDDVDAMLALGAPDRRPAALPAAYAGLIARVELPADELELLRGLEPRVRELAGELGDAVPATVSHEEIHEGNVFAGSRPRVFDWGEACVSHPFTGLVNTLRGAVADLGVEPGGPELDRLCDVYLEPWTRFAPLPELRAALQSAYALGCLCRMLTWDQVVTPLDAGERAGYTEPLPGWVHLWAGAATGTGRLGELE